MSRDRSRILALLRGGGRFLITSHINPDGDSIASQCALRMLVERLGGRAQVVNSQPVPRVYRFLPGAAGIRSSKPRSWEPYRALLVLDCGDADRAGGLLEPRPPVPVVNIDHHATNPGYGDLNLVDTEACSTAEIVYGLCVALGVRPTGGLAQAIYTGILTDTGSFRHGNATPRTFLIASRLVAAGLDPAHIARAVYESVPFETLRVLGRTLADLQQTPDGRVAWIRLPFRVIDSLGSPAESEEWAAYPRSLDTARISLCFKDTGAGKVRVSFRSKGAVDVAALAARWGGGGHRSAAGATFTGTLASAERAVVSAAVRLLGPIRASSRPAQTTARRPPTRAHAGR